MEKHKYKNRMIIFAIGVLYILIVLKYNIGIPCILHELTGLYCPGCGGTRAIISLMKFNPYQAFRYNSLVTIIIPFAFIYLIYKYILNGKKDLPNWVWYLLLIIAILFAIIRNIPTFYYLLPTKVYT